MRILNFIMAGSLVLGIVGCATDPATPEVAGTYEHPKLTPKAREMVMEQGAATAVERGYSTNSDLVCETRKKTGSHMTERVCYTRLEAAEIRRESQETMRRTNVGGTRVGKDNRQPCPRPPCL